MAAVRCSCHGWEQLWATSGREKRGSEPGRHAPLEPSQLLATARAQPYAAILASLSRHLRMRPKVGLDPVEGAQALPGDVVIRSELTAQSVPQPFVERPQVVHVVDPGETVADHGEPLQADADTRGACLEGHQARRYPPAGAPSRRSAAARGSTPRSRRRSAVDVRASRRRRGSRSGSPTGSHGARGGRATWRGSRRASRRSRARRPPGTRRGRLRPEESPVELVRPPVRSAMRPPAE